MPRAHPLKQLEYLLLSPVQQMTYRNELGISARQIYDFFLPSPIDGDYVSSTQARKVLGYSPMTFARYKRQGFFGDAFHRVGKESLMSVEKLNELRNRRAQEIPVEYLTYLAKKRYGLGEESFRKWFGRYYEPSVVRTGRSVSMRNAAKIISTLRMRKERIEQWQTLDDLYKRSGNTETRSAAQERYLQLINAGKMRAILCAVYDPKGVVRGSEYKLSPKRFARELNREKQESVVMQSSVTVKDLSTILALNPREVVKHIHIAVREGVIDEPVRMKRGPGGGESGRFFLTPAQADAIVKWNLSLEKICK